MVNDRLVPAADRGSCSSGSHRDCQGLTKLPDLAGSMIGCRPGPSGIDSTHAALQAFEKASGETVKYKLVPRRQGDSVAVWAATETAEKQLGWKTKLGVDDMCRDQWNWASQYPKGYEV